jgi:hypothetical protein
LRNYRTAVHEVDYWINSAYNAGAGEEVILGIVDIVYHPDHYADLTDED